MNDLIEQTMKEFEEKYTIDCVSDGRAVVNDYKGITAFLRKAMEEAYETGKKDQIEMEEINNRAQGH